MQHLKPFIVPADLSKSEIRFLLIVSCERLRTFIATSSQEPCFCVYLAQDKVLTRTKIQACSIIVKSAAKSNQRGENALQPTMNLTC